MRNKRNGLIQEDGETYIQSISLVGMPCGKCYHVRKVTHKCAYKNSQLDPLNKIKLQIKWLKIF
jgi:hypothetical protein